MTRRVKSAVRRAPNRLGTVEALPSGRYRAFYRREGRKFTAPRTFATHTEADSWLAAEFADRARGVWRDPDTGRVTLAEFATDWLAARPDLAPRTRDLYRRNLDRWILPRVGRQSGSRGVELGAMFVADLTPATVRAWRAGVYADARASASRMLAREHERGEHPARVWARGKGMPVAAVGRISPAVMKAWREAGEPQPARKPLTTVVPLESAGETTTAQAYRVLRAILSTAVTDGLLTANPCQIRGAGQVAHKERPTATPAEVAQIAAHMPPQYAAAVTLAAWSGLRFGELFALARRHVDLEAGTVQVERALVAVPGQPIRFGKTKTAKSLRTVHLPAFVVEALTAHLRDHVPADPDALLFPSSSERSPRATADGRAARVWAQRRGIPVAVSGRVSRAVVNAWQEAGAPRPDGAPRPPALHSDGSPVSNRTISRHFTSARIVAGRPDLRWHDLRHTGATLAYRAGASVPEVQARLGHSTMRAAQIYAHTAADSDAALARNLDALYAEASEGIPHLRAV